MYWRAEGAFCAPGGSAARRNEALEAAYVAVVVIIATYFEGFEGAGGGAGGGSGDPSKHPSLVRWTPGPLTVLPSCRDSSDGQTHTRNRTRCDGRNTGRKTGAVSVYSLGIEMGKAKSGKAKAGWSSEGNSVLPTTTHIPYHQVCLALRPGTLAEAGRRVQPEAWCCAGEGEECPDALVLTRSQRHKRGAGRVDHSTGSSGVFACGERIVGISPQLSA